MLRILKALGRFIFLTVPVLIIVVGAAMLWLSRSLPPAAGTVQLAGLSDTVRIARDENGVPHISGATRNDVFSGLGFAHAQDRLWQMEISRMAGQGRLSEIFGAPTIDTDVWLRTMGIYEASEASFDTLSPEAQDALNAYARGVNAWIERENRFFASRFPPEFVILGHTPEPWTAVDTVATIKMMSVGLAENVGEELSRLAFARLGLNGEEIEDLLPAHALDNPPPLPDLKALLGLESGPIEEAGHTTASLGGGFGPIDERAGTGASNNWVVSGARTETGKPILANDPHLGFDAPAIWYLAHLRVEEEFDEPRNLVGTSLAGTPFVLLGRNDNIAWGFTNTGSDVQDIFFERVNPDNPEEYLTPSGWAKFDLKQETIKVSGGEDHVFTRRRTRHGPVLPDGYGDLKRYLPENTVAALQWVALARDDTTSMIGYDLWEYDTVADYQNGMRVYVTPMQSMVIADSEGAIGMIAAGRVPLRDPSNLVAGRAPVPGWNGLYDWRGTIPFEGLPRENDPENGAIGTANTRIVAADYPYHLTYDWDETYRQQRVDELIVDADGPQTIERSREAQADVHSQALGELRDRMIALVEGRDDVDSEAISALKAWNANMDVDRFEPLLMTAWMRRAMIEIFADDLGPAFPRWFQLRAGPTLTALGDDPARDWCDNRKTDGAEDCAAILAEALDAALSQLRAAYGTDMTDWKWGKAHVALSEHRPFGRVPPLDRLFNVTVEHGGGMFTLDRGRMSETNEKAPFTNVSGASYRGLFDLADLEKSTYMITTGQSGNVFSRHYRDFAEPWSQVEAFTIPTEPSSYADEIDGVWQLTP